MQSYQNLEAPKMEAVALKFWTWVFTITGVPSALATVFLYWGTWKADVVFFLAVISLVVRLGFEVTKKLDESDARKIQNKRDRLDLERERNKDKGTDSEHHY